MYVELTKIQGLKSIKVKFDNNYIHTMNHWRINFQTDIKIKNYDTWYIES